MIGKRVVVRRSRSAKYGKVVGETKDQCYWIVLLDGSRDTVRVVKDRVATLSRWDAGYYLGGVR